MVLTLMKVGANYSPHLLYAKETQINSEEELY